MIINPENNSPTKLLSSNTCCWKTTKLHPQLTLKGGKKRENAAWLFKTPSH